MTELPTATRTDTITVCGYQLRVYQLSDGRRVINSGDFNALWAEMRRGLEVPESDLARVRRFMRGDLQ